jgi:hypothetical protein
MIHVGGSPTLIAAKLAMTAAVNAMENKAAWQGIQAGV